MLHNDINDKKYIGCTKQLDLRFKQHLRSLKGGYNSSKSMQNDYDKFKFNISYKILFETDDKDLAYSKEEEIIYKFNTKNVGYNSSDGGLFNKGYVQSDYAKEVASKVHSQKTGEKNSFYGKKHSEETKLKLSQLAQGINRYDRTDEYRDMMSKSNPLKKQIYYYGKIYHSIGYASRVTGNTRQTIRKRLNDNSNNEAYFM